MATSAGRALRALMTATAVGALWAAPSISSGTAAAGSTSTPDASRAAATASTTTTASPAPPSAAAAATPPAAEPTDTTATAQPPATTSTAAANPSAPPTQPLPAPDPAADPSNYAFYEANADGTPIRWNPCGAVHWVFNPAGGPAGAIEEVQGAFDRLAQATGMTFVYDGTTDEPPSRDRTGYDPARYPHRWAPVLVAFGEPGALGLTQMRWATPSSGPSVAYTGWVILQASAAWEPGSSTTLGLGRVLQHELGHLVGLAHAPRPGVIMNTAPTGMDGYAPGDLAGLAQVGRGAGCLWTVPPPP